MNTPTPEKKTRSKRIAGICADADALGVTREHLWAVLKGRRFSKPLLARYQSLKTGQNPTDASQAASAMSENPRFQTGAPDPSSASPHPGHVEAAADNYLETWPETLGELGFAVICIQMRSCPLAFEQAEFIESLGSDFAGAGLGYLDSSLWQPQICHFFYADTKRLSDALQFLKSKLHKQKLLTISAIAYRDVDEKVWRTFYSGAPTPSK